MKSTNTLGVLGLAIMLHGMQPVLAAEAPLQERLQACARLQNNAERLSCYDRTVANIDNPAAPAPAAAPETMFGVGAQLSRQVEPVQRVEREELQSISAQVKAVRTVSGVILIDLDNDQTWQQMETTPLLLKVGEPVTITRGAFNSFRLSTQSKRAARVKRLQ